MDNFFPQPPDAIKEGNNILSIIIFALLLCYEDISHVAQGKQLCLAGQTLRVGRLPCKDGWR